MNTEIPNKFIITYSNQLTFEGRLLAFRKKELFDISDSIPKYIPFNGNYWLIKRKQLTIGKARNLTINKSIDVDVSSIQWHQQEQLNHVFNL